MKLKRIKLLYVALGVIFLSLYLMSFGDTWNKPLSYLATCALPFAPEFIALFKVKVPERLQRAYLAFLFPAMILGIDLNFYYSPYSYDKIIHAASGLLAAVVAKEIIRQNAPKSDPKFKRLFIIGFVSLTAVAWEVFEFLYDTLTGSNMQQLISEGLSDTMWDITSAFAVGLIASFLLIRDKRKRNSTLKRSSGARQREV